MWIVNKSQLEFGEKKFIFVLFSLFFPLLEKKNNFKDVNRKG